MRKKQNLQEYSDKAKRDYYALRVNDKSLTVGQREFAQRRLNELSGEISSAPRLVCSKKAAAKVSSPSKFDKGYAQGVYAVLDYADVSGERKNRLQSFYDSQKQAANKGDQFGKGVIRGIRDASNEVKHLKK